MKKTMQGKPVARTLRLDGETIKKLGDNQLHQAAGGGIGGGSGYDSFCNFCPEDTFNCFSQYGC